MDSPAGLLFENRTEYIEVPVVVAEKRTRWVASARWLSPLTRRRGMIDSGPRLEEVGNLSLFLLFGERRHVIDSKLTERLA